MRKLGDDCGSYLAEKAESQESIWVLDGDLADSDGAEQFSARCPNRFVQAGISEQCMVSAAAGMASCGIRPWVFSFAAFLCYRAYDQIRVGLSQTQLPVTLIGSHAGGCGGRNGKTHIALNDVAVISTLPNMDIWGPADGNDVRLAVDSILSANGPNYIRLPRTPLPLLSGKPAIARWIGSPTPVALVTHGLATHWALEVQELLASNGVNVGVLHVNKLWPLDYILECGLLDQVRCALVLEDHAVLGGLGSLLRHIGYKGQMKQLGWPLGWSGQSGADNDLRQAAKLTVSDIVGEIEKLDLSVTGVRKAIACA